MSDPRFETLKGKYAPVLDKIQKLGAKLENLHVQDNKLVLKARAKTHGDSNLVWDEIKRIDPDYAGDLTAQLSFESEGPPSQAPAAPAAAPAALKTYTVEAGDTLSKIAKRHYGDASAYHRIFEANRDQLSDPDKIRPGQILKLPS